MAGRGSSSGGGRPPTPEEMARINKALELRAARMPYDMIAEKLGYSTASSARRAVNSALRWTFREGADSLRRSEAASLDELQRHAWQRVVEGKPGAIADVLRVMTRRAHLLGLDMPVQTQVSVKVETDQAMQLLAALRGILTDLRLSPEQQDLSTEVVARHLRALTDTAHDPGAETVDGEVVPEPDPTHPEPAPDPVDQPET